MLCRSLATGNQIKRKRIEDTIGAFRDTDASGKKFRLAGAGLFMQHLSK
jgi:hypothetical protein